ncbi:MAG: thiamine pyrophosphate-binding protein [Victivallales bacterium]
MKVESQDTVGKYLIKRLRQVGVNHVFGVPGDYVLEFFSMLEKSEIGLVCTCNELNAGYAADAYSRVNGIGAVCVTYGVGGFSLLNAVVGAYAERVPMIVISGAPRLAEKRYHHLLHHTFGDMNLQSRIYEQATVYSAVLSNPASAGRQIDEAITTCLRSRRPVYIEIPMDIINLACPQAREISFDRTIHSDADSLAEAVEEAAALMNSAKKPAMLAGVEVHRLGMQDQLRKFLSHAGMPFATSLLGKSVISEQHPLFTGIYGGAASWESARRTVLDADMLLSLGVLMTDIELGGRRSIQDQSKMIIANSDNVRIKHHIYNHVGLEDFIVSLGRKICPRKVKHPRISYPYGNPDRKINLDSSSPVTVNGFYSRINRFIGSENILTADSGDSMLSAANLFLPEGVAFINQAFYLSIGYAVPATLGICLALPGKRPIAFVGDGAFQATAQEMSTIIKLNLKPVIFISNNQGYLTERLLNEDGPFNDVNVWKYHRIADVFSGGIGLQVKTNGELEEALARIKSNPDSAFIVELVFDKWDCSENLKLLKESL